MRQKGQILVETALTLGIIFSLSVMVIVASYMAAQRAVMLVVLAGVCESYAESPDVRGTVSASIPYLWLPTSVGLPPMSIDVAGKTFHSQGGVLTFSPLDTHPPLQFSCVATAQLGGDFPMLEVVDIRTSASYTTVRRYGGVTEQPAHTPAISSAPLFSPLVVLPALLLRPLKFRRKAVRLRGAALIEYAIVNMAIMVFIVSVCWSLVYCVFVLDVSGRAAKTIALAARGDNPAAIDVSFSNCSFSAGQPVDCNGRSPFSLAAPYVPSMSFSANGLTITVYGGE